MKAKQKEVIDAITTAIIDYPSRWVLESNRLSGQVVRWTTKCGFTYAGIQRFVARKKPRNATVTKIVKRSHLPYEDESVYDTKAKMARWEES